MPLKSIQMEYTRYRIMAEKAVAQVSDEKLFARLSDAENSVAIIVNHVAGNLLSRFTDFLTTDGEKPWRHRDTEFEQPAPDRAKLMARWDEAFGVLEAQLDGLTDEHVHQMVSIRGKEISVIAALHRSMAHVALHVGQIILLCRHHAGESWEYLSIPPGQSDAYNKNPTLEIRPQVGNERPYEG